VGQAYSNHHNMEKKLRIAKTIMNIKRTSRGITTPDFKLYYRVIVIRAA
jgi:hypothetical protein